MRRKRIISILLIVMLLLSINGWNAAYAYDGSGTKYGKGTGLSGSNDDWIKAYIDFIEDEEYLSSGQSFGDELEKGGFLFDMDQDGIPELSIYSGGGDGIAHTYTYEDEAVAYIGDVSSTPLVRYDETTPNGANGDLYGYTSEKTLVRYEKKGLSIDCETYEERQIQYYDPEYESLPRHHLENLKEGLPVYSEVRSIADNPSGAISELDSILLGLAYYGGEFDYTAKTYEESDLEHIFNIPHINPNMYSTGAKIEHDAGLYQDPKEKYISCDIFNAEKTDWYLKNVFNYNDDLIDKLHSDDSWEGEDDLGYYYKDYYYSRPYGNDDLVWYDDYINSIEDLGGVYHICYTQITYDEMDSATSDEKYALAAYKNLDGKNFWSIYYISSDPLYDKADTIDVGITISDKYKPYPIVAIKSLDTGCYLSCDNGKRDKRGKYPNIDKPSFSCNKSTVGENEKFYKIPLSNGKYAFQSCLSMKYLSKNKNRVGDFADRDERFDLNADGTPSSDTFSCYDISNAEIVLIDDNKYSKTELNVISNGEWFNLNNGGAGYWNIQQEIGIENNAVYNYKSDKNVESLKSLHYETMYRRDKGWRNKNTIEYGNMQCSIGVKKQNGIYDVIIAFQGTGGYSDEEMINLTMDNEANLHNTLVTFNKKNTVRCHSGYKTMAYKLVDGNAVSSQEVMTYYDGKELTLTQLINKAKYGGAKFTILGHSMGGAIAQIYALYLVNCGIAPSNIKGRTFNSALAFADDTINGKFTDWYNLCVTSDSVPRGFVPGSVKDYGMHRLGKTIWLYDNEPDVGIGYIPGVNISTDMHNMDKKIKQILDETTSSVQTGYHEVDSEVIFTTNKDKVPVYDRPMKDSDPDHYIRPIHSVVNIKDYVFNDYGNKWYRTTDGKYIYEKNLDQIWKRTISGTEEIPMYVCVDDTPVRSGFYKESDVLYRLKSGDKIKVDYAVVNDAGHYWFHISESGKSGWIYKENVSLTNLFIKKSTTSVDCPVNVKLCDSDGEILASIIDDEIYTYDEEKICPYTIGSGKFFDIADDIEYTVEIESLSNGLMDYTVQTGFDEKTGEYESTKKYTSVTLDESELFSCEAGGDIKAEDMKLNIVDSNGKVIAEAESYKPGKSLNGRNLILMVIIYDLLVALTICVTLLIMMLKKRNR